MKESNISFGCASCVWGDLKVAKYLQTVKTGGKRLLLVGHKLKELNNKGVFCRENGAAGD